MIGKNDSVNDFGIAYKYGRLSLGKSFLPECLCGLIAKTIFPSAGTNANDKAKYHQKYSYFWVCPKRRLGQRRNFRLESEVRCNYFRVTPRNVYHKLYINPNLNF